MLNLLLYCIVQESQKTVAHPPKWLHKNAAELYKAKYISILMFYYMGPRETEGIAIEQSLV